MRLAPLAAAALCVSSLAAHADTIQNYILNATLMGGRPVYGTLNFDETTGLFTGGSVSMILAGETFLVNNFDSSFHFDSVTVLMLNNGYSVADYLQNSLTLVIPGNPDVDYAGGAICSLSYATGCGVTDDVGKQYQTAASFGTASLAATGGSLVPTPEPSSIALLGTGLLGVVGITRRRLF